MPQLPAPSPARGLGVATATLVTAAIVLVLAFVYAPAPAAAARSGVRFTDEQDLRAGFRAEFDAYWNSSRSGFPARLDAIVDYWFHYHVTKAVTAALLVAVCAALGVVLYRAVSETPRTRALSTTSGALLTVTGASALILTLANIQGAAAPFASLLPMLTDTAPDRELADTLDQLGTHLASGEHARPAVDVIVGDFTRYHLVMAVLAATAALALFAAGAACWKSARVPTPAAGGRRRGPAALGVCTVVLATALSVVAVANTTTTADPVPALRAAVDGGW